MPVARPESSDSRVIAHVDMDCFYVQGLHFSPSLSHSFCVRVGWVTQAYSVSSLLPELWMYRVFNSRLFLGLSILGGPICCELSVILYTKMVVMIGRITRATVIGCEFSIGAYCRLVQNLCSHELFNYIDLRIMQALTVSVFYVVNVFALFL